MLRQVVVNAGLGRRRTVVGARNVIRHYARWADGVRAQLPSPVPVGHLVGTSLAALCGIQPACAPPTPTHNTSNAPGRKDRYRRDGEWRRGHAPPW